VKSQLGSPFFTFLEMIMRNPILFKKLAFTLIVPTLMICFAPSRTRAEGICGTGDYTILVPDGRILAGTIPASTLFSFVIGGHDTSATLPRSYSVEVRGPNGGFFGAPNLFVRDDTTCTLANTVSVNNTVLTAPRIGCDGCASPANLRYSFTTVNRFTHFVVQNATTGSLNYSISVSETTMFNPRWSTFSGFVTQWGFQNTTESSISGTLTVLDSVSGGPYTKSVTVAPNATVFAGSGETFLGGSIPANHAGGATFVHNGPPGSIKADAYLLNSNLSVIVPTEFKAVRESAH
jgi:hypothetical protein